MIELRYLFFNNPTKSTSFHAPAMSMLAGRLLEELRAVYAEYCSETVSSRSAFMNSKLLRALDAVEVGKNLILNNIPLFDYNPATRKRSGLKVCRSREASGQSGAKAICPSGTRRIRLVWSDRREQSKPVTGPAETEAKCNPDAVLNIFKRAQ